jgi:hypothetical protein
MGNSAWRVDKISFENEIKSSLQIIYNCHAHLIGVPAMPLCGEMIRLGKALQVLW